MEDNYTKRELDEHFKDIENSIAKATAFLSNENQEIKGGVRDLNTKVAIQNGRVTKSEGRINSIFLGVTIIVFLGGTIVGLTIYSFKLSQENLKATILLEVRNLIK